MNPLIQENPGPQSPGELYMAFGPDHRVVKFRTGGEGTRYLIHVVRGGDRLWRQDCEAQAFVDDPEGSSLYQALRNLIDACPALEELEP